MRTQRASPSNNPNQAQNQNDIYQNKSKNDSKGNHESGISTSHQNDVEPEDEPQNLEKENTNNPKEDDRNGLSNYPN